MNEKHSEENLYQSFTLRLRDIFGQFYPGKMKDRFHILKSFFNEPATVKRYASPLNMEKRISEYFGLYTWIILFVTAVWFIVNLLIVAIDLPSRFPLIYEPYFIQDWNSHLNFLPKLQSYLSYSSTGLFIGILLGGALSLPYAFIISYVGGICFGFAISLATAFSTGFYNDSALGISFGLSFGLAFAIPAAVFKDFLKIVSGGIIILFAFFLTGGLDFGIGMLAGIPIFLLIYFRIPFFLFTQIKGILCQSLENTPYHRDGFIWLPIIGLKRKLLTMAKQDTRKAFAFSDFLLKDRPLQIRLSLLTIQAVTSSHLNENSRNPIATNEIINKKNVNQKLKPSPSWYKTIASLRAEFETTKQPGSIDYQQDYRQRYLEYLQKFREHTILWEPLGWNKYYEKTLKQSIHNEEDELFRIQQKSNGNETITHNIYRVGSPLTPEHDRKIFFGRESIVEQLQVKIRTSSQMPIFLIQGQRRVGKTSFLKFLPILLGQKYKVVYMDLQPINSIPQWLKGLKKAFDLILRTESAPLNDVEQGNWLTMWKLLNQYMEKVVEKVDSTIILAMDEYEKLQFHFRKSPATAKRLLEAIRNFSQRQNKIVFLFGGSTFFSELKKPYWENYFVHYVQIKIDYLNRENTLKLISRSGLDYPEDVINRIAYLTQGHPALVQRICNEMVNIANIENRHSIVMKDLDDILLKYIFRPQNGVTDVFWHQFCENRSMKNTVLKIIREEPINDNKSIFILEEHGFIVKDETSQKYKMRVPIFQQWLYKFGGYI